MHQSDLLTSQGSSQWLFLGNESHGTKSIRVAREASFPVSQANSNTSERSSLNRSMEPCRVWIGPSLARERADMVRKNQSGTEKSNGQQSLPLKAERTKKLDVSALENWLWEAACTSRGPLDAPKFKVYILPLIFLKRLSDVFDDEVAHLAHEFGDVKKAAKLVEQDHKLVRFYMPQEGPVVVHRREVNRPGRASDGCGAGDRQGEPTALGCDRLDRLQPHGGRSADGR